MDIDIFKSTINRYGLMDGNRYMLIITGPLETLDKELSQYCSKVTIPGRGFSTVERFDHGPERNVPYLEIYTPINITFMCDREMKIYKFFENWQLLISGGNSFYMPFYDDIIGSAKIFVLDRQGNTSSEIVLTECYPSKLTDIDLSYEADGVQTFDVELNYHHREIVK